VASHDLSKPLATTERDMPDQLRVFISSTYSDLREYRAAVVSTLARFGLMPVRLEEFGSAAEPALAAALDAIESSDIVIVLVAHRLGYVPPEGDKSLVELEYEKAREFAKPTFCFLLDDDQPWPPSQIDADHTRVGAFRKRLLEQHSVARFTTPDDLAAKVALAISQYSRHIEGLGVAPPSVVAPERPVTSTDDVLSELKAMRVEFSALQQLIGDSLRRSTPASSTVSQNPNASSADFLGPPAAIVDRERCFVIMPYSQKWSGAVERIILEVCGEVGLTFEIAKNMEGRFIPHDIWRGITGAGVIVADLSGANPNVTYEVGLADVIGREIVLIAQQANVPFDFLAQRLILYEDSLPGSLTLREELKDRLERYKAKRKGIGVG
jgi:hypothetical protein